MYTMYYRNAADAALLMLSAWTSLFFVGLLHVILVGCLEHTPLALLVVEEPEFHLDVHRVLKLLDALLHRAKIASEVVLRLFLDKREYDGELVEEVVDSVEDGVDWQVGVR